MIHPNDFVCLGVCLGDELSRVAAGFHDKDEAHDGWAGAADEARKKTDEVRSLLKLPGLAEELANAPALREAQELPIDAPLDQKRAQFERIYRTLAPIFETTLKAAWLGEWEINDDGLLATLRLTPREPSSVDPARAMMIEYIDQGGIVFRGWIRKFDWRGHHLTFYVAFGASTRDFDAYLFKWDKNKLAGIADGRGFCATKTNGFGAGGTLYGSPPAQS